MVSNRVAVVNLDSAYIVSKVGPPTHADRGQRARLSVAFGSERLDWCTDRPQSSSPRDSKLDDAVPLNSVGTKNRASIPDLPGQIQLNSTSSDLVQDQNSCSNKLGAKWPKYRTRPSKRPLSDAPRSRPEPLRASASPIQAPEAVKPLPFSYSSTERSRQCLVWMDLALRAANSGSGALVGCSLVSGLLMQSFMLTAGPDGIR